MDINLRGTMSDRFVEIIVNVDQTTIDLGLFNADELETLAEKLAETVEEMQDYIKRIRDEEEMSRMRMMRGKE